MRRAGVLCAALALGSCKDATPLVSPHVTVEKFDAAHSCYAVCPSSPALMLSLGDACAAAADACDFVAGGDRMRVVVDYLNVPFAASAVVPPPTLTLYLDDREQAAPAQPKEATPLDITDEKTHEPTGYTRRYFVTSFVAPAQTAEQLRVRAKGGEGFVGEVGKLRIKAGAAMVKIASCPDLDRCSMVADVGQASLTVSIPAGLTMATGTVSSRLNQLPLSETVPLRFSEKGTALEASPTLVVPAPNAGRMGTFNFWDLDVSIGGLKSIPIHITLTDPTITLTVASCQAADGGAGCSLKAGSPLTVVVSAPAEIHQSQASLMFEVDGAPSGSLLPKTWSVETATTRSAIYSLTVPAMGKVFSLRAYVGKFEVAGESITIVP